MIPAFPQFKGLTLEDNDVVEAHNKNFPYYSDYNFASLWSWDIGHQRQISDLNGNLVVKFTDYETGEPFLSYLGMNDTLNTANALLAYSEAIGLRPILKLVPEISVYNIDSPALTVTPDLDNFDYVYLTSRMATLRGNQYRYKRQDAEKFVKMNENHGFEIRDLGDPTTQQAIRAITAEWRKMREISPDDQSIIHETEAIENIFTVSKIRDIFVGIVTVNGHATAYSIEEITNRIFSIGHFWKTAARVQGEYEFMAREMASYLELREVTYWNWEQDLGHEALRTSKLSYRPSDFLKKFTITRSAQ